MFRTRQLEGQRFLLCHLQAVPHSLDIVWTGLHRDDHDLHSTRHAEQKNSAYRAETGHESETHTEQNLE